MFEQIFGHLAGDPLLAQIGSWILSIQNKARGPWWFFAQTGKTCHTKCGNNAIDTCRVCNKNTCLSHAAVFGDGSIFCTTCVFSLLPEDEPYPEPPPRRQSKRANQPPPPPGMNYQQMVDAHLKVMGLKEPSSVEEIKQEFKQLVLKYHPDRVLEHEREASTKKFVKVKESYEWLMANYKKAA